MRKLFIGLFIFMASTLPALANEALEQAILTCSKVEETEKRLECFNTIVQFIEDRAKTDASEGYTRAGNWLVSRTSSPMDDSKKFAASLDVKEKVNGVIPTLILRCSENKTDVFINWDKFIGGDSSSVQVRIDKEPAQKEYWGVSTSNKATFSQNPIALAKKLSKAKVLLVRVVPYNEAPIMAEFDLEGIGPIIDELKLTCNWK